MSFREYCSSHGIHLLRDDVTFIRSKLANFDYDERKTILRHYVEVWCDAMEDTSNAAQAMNLGRRAANLWLISNCVS